MGTAQATYDHGHPPRALHRRSIRQPGVMLLVALGLACGAAGIVYGSASEQQRALSPAQARGSHHVVARTAAAARSPSRATATDRGRPVLAGLSYLPRTLVVRYHGDARTLLAAVKRRTGVVARVSSRPSLAPNQVILALPAPTSVPALARTLATLPGVGYAVPDYVAHIAGSWYPNDTGRGDQAEGWEKLQWNFMPAAGVNAPQAWWNLLHDRRPGARGVTVAVIDTGVAFRDWHTFKRSPDFGATQFVDPCDLIAGTLRDRRCTDPDALDREGHGTFVAGLIAESTNNHYGLTGLAYQASIMPIRALNAAGNGDATTIAAGIRYAVHHRARVINLSIEFSPGTTSAEIPEIASAITYAHDHGVVVVGATGNDEVATLDYPAALPDVISVGATTRDLCLAAYSNTGSGIDLVAPGGGADAPQVAGSNCHPNRGLPDIYQMTFADAAHPTHFGLPGGWFGTSMAAPEVAAAAAMVIASGVLGPQPTPDAILARLEATARPLGPGPPNDDYGYGLLDVGAATAAGGPLAPPASPNPPPAAPARAAR